MGRISELSDELLIKILSFLPTKAAASTSVLSKQWKFLWMWLPKLEFGSTHISEFELKRLRCFLLGNLSLHRAPVIESFCLKIPLSHMDTKPEEVKQWVQFAVSRDVRELDISYPRYIVDQDLIHSSLYTCKFLVTLKLGECTLVDVPPMVCLPSLKILRLHNVIYSNKDSLQLLLSNCPVLEDLWMYGFTWGDTEKMIIIVPSLLRLSIQTFIELKEFVIDSPSLKYLKLKYFNYLHVWDINMPKLREASVEVSFPCFKRLIRSILSVKHLTLCLPFDNKPTDVYDDGFVLNKLKNLKLCICQYYLANVLVQFLKISPNLRVLELFILDEDHEYYGMHHYDQPSIVPECMLSSLEMFKWSGYGGSKEERELAIYILQNARHLKTATFFLFYKYDLDKTFEMKKELELSSRASTTCQLVFL